MEAHPPSQCALGADNDHRRRFVHILNMSPIFTGFLYADLCSLVDVQPMFGTSSSNTRLGPPWPRKYAGARLVVMLDFVEDCATGNFRPRRSDPDRMNDLIGQSEQT